MTIDDVVNVKLLLHPVNWLIVWVVIMIFGLGLAMVTGHIGQSQPPVASTNS